MGWDGYVHRFHLIFLFSSLPATHFSMTTPTPTPSASDALQKARELRVMEKQWLDSGFHPQGDDRLAQKQRTKEYYDWYIENLHHAFPSIHAELEKVTVERDVALKGYREMREALKFYKKLDDEMLRFNRGLLAKKDMEDIDGVAHKALTSFPEIK